MAHRKVTFRSSYLIFLLIIALALIFINAIAARYFKRYDLTQEKVFSVSEAAERIFSKLNDRVHVTYYISDEVPDQIRNLKRDTVDKFKEFEIYSNGNFTWELVNPDKDEQTERELNEARIPKLRGIVIKKDKQEALMFYSALIIRYMDKPKKVIPDYFYVQVLEYEIARNILQLTTEEKPKVKFFTSIEAPPPADAPPRFQQPQDQYTAVLEIDEIKGEFDISRTKLTKDDTVDSKTDCLIIAQPENLNERQNYEIDNYLSDGGSVIMFVGQRTLDKNNLVFKDIRSGLDDLFKFWGFTVENKMVADMNSGMLSLTQTMGRSLVTQTVPLALIIKAIDEGLNRQSPITSKIRNLSLPWAAPITADKPTLKKNGLAADILVRSSSRSWVLKNNPKALSQEALYPPASEEEFDGGKTLALLVTGKFPSYYAGKPAPKWPGEEVSDTASMAESEDTATLAATPISSITMVPEEKEKAEPRKGKLLVVSNADMIKLDYLKTPGYNDNILFFLNSLELLSLGEDLIKIRTKTLSARALKETTSSQKLMLRIFNIAVVPGLLICVGLIRLLWRRREKKAYLESLKAGETEKDKK